ncbi:MAG: hypothetical protein AAF211_17200 [Myxococcota bacterium]
MSSAPLWLLALYGPRLVSSVANVGRPSRYSRSARAARVGFEVMVLALILLHVPPQSPFWRSSSLLWGAMVGEAAIVGFTLITLPILSWQEQRQPLPTRLPMPDGLMVGSLVLCAVNEELLLRGVLLFGLWDTLGGVATCALCVGADLLLHAYQGRRLVWFHLLAAAASIGLALSWGVVAAISFHLVHNLWVLFEAWRRNRPSVSE